jgi:hypothetical protein
METNMSVFKNLFLSLILTMLFATSTAMASGILVPFDSTCGSWSPKENAVFTVFLSDKGKVEVIGVRYEHDKGPGMLVLGPTEQLEYTASNTNCNPWFPQKNVIYKVQISNNGKTLKVISANHELDTVEFIQFMNQ